jgi:hypothetical protein
VSGAVFAPRSSDRADIPVLLFAAGAAGPAELTHTDSSGRFAFQQVFARFHVVAVPPRGSGFAPTWRVDLEPRVNDFVSLSLLPASPLEVQVTDPEGFPVSGAQVAVFALGRGGPLAADLARTDAAGHATVLAPERAGISARRPGFEDAYVSAPAAGPVHIVLATRR